MNQRTTRYIFGSWQKDEIPLTPAEVSQILEKAAALRQEVAHYPAEKILGILERVRGSWLNPRYALRQEMLEKLPAVTGFSEAMVRKGIEELCWTFDPDALQKKIATELNGIPRVNDPGYHLDPNSGTIKQWHPLGVVLHVLAGNVFVGAAGSLVEGLITGNVNIFKMSSAEKLFLPALIQSLIECDDKGFLSRALAVLDFSSSQTEIVKAFKNGVDAVAVWGGEEAVKAYRNDLAARTKFIVFGPKLSLAVVSATGLKEQGLSATAAHLAKDLIIWDQNACTAPQLCYVEGVSNAHALADALAGELEKAAKILPAGSLDRHNAVELRKFRNVAELAEALGEGRLLESPKNLDWTLYVDNNQEITPSPLHRSLRLVPFQNPQEVIKNIGTLRGYIQSVGLTVSGEETIPWFKKLSDAGALRIVSLGKMALGEIDDPHDGNYDLPQFMRLVFNRTAPAFYGCWKAEDQERWINQKLRSLLRHAKNSKFYAARLNGLRLETVADLAKIPPLKREEMEANVPPAGTGLATKTSLGGYVSRSGGSTGIPKFSIYDAPDWERMIAHGAQILRAMGLNPQDRLANCMLAGDLYGSFVSFDHINVRLGATSFAFGGHAKPEAFLDVWRLFNINAVEGIPSILLPLLRSVKKMEPSFQLEKLIYAGTPLSGADRGWLKQELKMSRVASIIGANDGGQIAFQCEFMEGAMHHAVDDFNYVEIVDDGGRLLPEGEAGRILITSLLKYAFPLIRYELGDSGRIVAGPCPCGRPLRRLEYLGRADELISVGLINLNFSDIRKTLAKYPISELQLAVKNSNEGEHIVIRVESEHKAHGLKDAISNALLEEIKTLKEQLAQGSLKKMEVEIYGPGALPRHARSGKLKNVVDERT